VLDGRVRRLQRLGRAGEVLLGGEPFRLVRLSEAGGRVLDALVGEGPPASEPNAAGGLAGRLVAGAMLHPVPRRRPPPEGAVAVVVPVRDDAGRLARLLHVLRRDFAGEIVVVDDGSAGRPGAADRIAEVTSRLGGVLHRSSPSAGPAAARNAGASVLAATEPAPLIAFVDVDVVPEGGWLDGLVGHFDDPRVAAVAPRVRAGRGVGRAGHFLHAYESVRSPLDLGSAPAMVGAHRRVSYVPSAALVCRRSSLDDVGWFDSLMRVGEDVDLVRRLETAGWTVRYEPAVRVWHDTRAGFSAFVRQRFLYGTSAADIERRHPGTVAPFEGTWWGTAATAAWAVFAGAAVVAAAAVAPRTLRRCWDPYVPFGPESRGAGGPAPRRGAAIAGIGAALVWLIATAVPVGRLRHILERAGVSAPTRRALAVITNAQLGQAGGLFTAVRRGWWPFALLAATLAPGLRRPALGVAAASELAGALGPWCRARRDDPGAERGSLAATLALGALDDLSYGTGVWVGCIQQRSFRALSPRLAPRAPAAPAGAGRGEPASSSRGRQTAAE
jgi:mycofactocin system glycosyltransferase